MVAVETINYTFFIVGKFDLTIVLWMLGSAILGMGSTHLYRYLLKRTDFFRKKAVSIWMVAFLSTVIMGFLLSSANFIPSLLTQPAAFWKSVRLIDVIGTTMNWCRYVGVWVIIYFMYQILKQNNAIQQEKLLVENLAKTTELELLKTQLNPHFLFNALNSIKALVTINPEQSRDAIVKLSELLRFTLQYGKERLIPLYDEMAEVKKYLSLEQLRFGPRLTVAFELAENTYSQTIPPALVLTLAENAIKHGVAKQEGNSTIRVRSEIADDQLLVQVINDGRYQPADTGGIGLQHITKRMDEIYHHTARFHILQEGNTVIATIQTPLSWQ